MASVNEQDAHGSSAAPLADATTAHVNDAIGSIPVSAVSNCRLPPFWRANPELWFLQVESSFQIHQVSSDNTKYHMVVAVIDVDTIAEVADVLRSPPPADKYTSLKDAILKRMTHSADYQLHKLLTGIELGDKKPSQLLREMRSLAKNRAGGDVLRVKWLDLLPPSVQRILRLFKDTKTLEELASSADEIYECSPTVMATTRDLPHAGVRTVDATHDQLLQEISALRRSIEQLTAHASRNTGVHAELQTLTNRSVGIIINSVIVLLVVVLLAATRRLLMRLQFPNRKTKFADAAPGGRRR